MKDTDILRFSKFIEQAERGEIEALNHQNIYEANIHTFSKIFEIPLEEDIADEIGKMAQSGWNKAKKAIPNPFSGMAKRAINKLTAKYEPNGYEKSIADDVLRSYEDEFNVVFKDHVDGLTVFSNKFWDDIFAILGVDGDTKEEFFGTFKRNLISIRDKVKEKRANVIAAVNAIKVRNNIGREVGLIDYYKNMKAIMVSSDRRKVLADENSTNALKDFHKSILAMRTEDFKPLMQEIIKKLTIDYINKKNATLKSSPRDEKDQKKDQKKDPSAEKKKEAVVAEAKTFSSRYAMFESQYIKAGKFTKEF